MDIPTKIIPIIVKLAKRREKLSLRFRGKRLFEIKNVKLEIVKY
jgi:hypothetical protein